MTITPASDRLEVLKVQEIPSGYDASQYATERLMLPARDGKSVPVSVVYRKGFKKDGNGPLFLYAYGAYGYAVPPSFSTARLSLLDRGYAYAIAHIRGGDDLGYQWFLDGKLTKRTNTFNDFVDAAKGLIAEGFTGPGRIAIQGGSAGGELMGAVANTDPELWGAVVADVPFVDVLNTMLDDTLPLTPGEWPEWGNPITDKAAFELIRSYSPYDKVKPQAYPPMLITGGLNDPRVTYWEPAKWAARLREMKTDDNLLLLKINMGAGHGGKSGRWNALARRGRGLCLHPDPDGGQVTAPIPEFRGDAVEVRDLVKDFGETRAVDGVSLRVPNGSIYGLLGPNGAGKTTLLRMLLGIIDPSSGTLRLLGRDRPILAAREVGYLPEERGLYPVHALPRSDRLHGRPARIAAGRRPPPGRCADGRAWPWRVDQEAGAGAVEGHGADRAIARHDHSQAAPDRPRRALLGPRRDQPGQAGSVDPARSRCRRDDHLFDPRHRPCRAAVPADRDHRRRQGRVRGRCRARRAAGCARSSA